MASTVIRGAQIKDSTVQRHDLDTSTVGQAVVTKLVQGSGITLSSTGADSGTGDVTVNSPDVVSTDAGNIATLGTDAHILVPQSQIWSVRLRNLNAAANSTFEVDQANTGTTLNSVANATRVADRWFLGRTGTLQVNTATNANNVVVPGTSFFISSKMLIYSLQTVQTTLGAGDYIELLQQVEGSDFRELYGDATSFSVLIKSSVFPLNISLFIYDPSSAHSYTKLLTIPDGNWNLLKAPNVPVVPAGSWTVNPGSIGAIFGLCFGAGSTFTAPADGVWSNGSFIASPGTDNWASKPAASTITPAFCQWEPGSQSTTPIDLDFATNLSRCQRFYEKSYDYASKPGTVITNGMYYGYSFASGNPYVRIGFKARMAKVPTVSAYSPATGAVANVRDYSSNTDRAVSGSNQPGETGFCGFTLTSPNASQALQGFHWVADTGW